eukprot:jgi/Astpho2/1108/fgenesh1_pg.00020_%23_9_t
MQPLVQPADACVCCRMGMRVRMFFARMGCMRPATAGGMGSTTGTTTTTTTTGMNSTGMGTTGRRRGLFGFGGRRGMGGTTAQTGTTGRRRGLFGGRRHRQQAATVL